VAAEEFAEVEVVVLEREREREKFAQRKESWGDDE